MYHSFLIHSSADGHLGCFHLLAIINSAVMNIGVHVSLSDLVSSLCTKDHFLKIFFLEDLFGYLQSLLNLQQYCFCFIFLVSWFQAMWDLSSPTRDQTHDPCIGRQSLNHWTTRNYSFLPIFNYLILKYYRYFYHSRKTL